MSFERVYTIWDYYDGVRSGIADYRGVPHFYSCEWDEAADDYSDTFILKPVDSETFALALEQWKIWREWERKFALGEVLRSTHPGLAGQDERYAQLKTKLDQRISSALPTERARAEFRPIIKQTEIRGIMKMLEVRWMPL
jgi:hypothetical protein